MTALEKAATVTMETPTAATLLQTAIEKGADVEAIEKLVGLMERLEDRAAAKAFHAALAAFQAECPRIPETATANVVSKRTGASFSYSYAELETIADHVRPYLQRHGLSYGWDCTVTEKLLSATCTLRHEAGHHITATFSCPIDFGDRMSSAQSTGAANTYAKRQSLVQVLGVTTGDADPDGQDAAEPIDVNQVVELEELWEMVTHGLTPGLTPEQEDKARGRLFRSLQVLPRDDGAFHFPDIPVDRFEAAKAMIEKRLAEQ